MARKQVLLVVYDIGSVSPARIGEAAREHDCTLLFALADSPYAREMESRLEDFGVVLDLDDIDGLREYEPDGIVTFSEYQLGATAELAAKLGLPYHDLAAIPAITRKDVQREALRAAGVDAVRAQTVRTPDDVDAALAAVGLPAVVKPTVGASSRNTLPLDDLDEAREIVTGLLDLESELIVEERLIGRPTPHPWGDYVAVDCCVVDAENDFPVFVSDKFALVTPFREHGAWGGRTPIPLAELKTLTELAGRAARAVGIRNGISHVELKLTADGPRVIEVNGRLGGFTDGCARRSGVSDPVGTAFASALGRSLPRPDALDDGEIVAEYLILPPTDATRVAAIVDLGLLSRLPGVERVELLTEAGAQVDWRIGSRSAVALVYTRTDTYEQLAELVDRVESARWIEYA